MRIEELLIHQADGPALAAAVYHPDTAAHRGAVVVAHGMLSFKESPKLVELCRACSAAGVLALRFDFRGRGSSGGDPEVLTISNEMADLSSVHSWLVSRGHGPIAWIGSSLGGTVALMLAPELRPGAIVSIGSPAHPPLEPRDAWSGRTSQDSGSKQPGESPGPPAATAPPPTETRIEIVPSVFILSRFFTDAATHDPVAAAASVTCPWLVAHGAQDEIVPVADARELAAACPSAELAVHPYADHRFSSLTHRAELVARVVSWTLRVLRDAAERSADPQP